MTNEEYWFWITNIQDVYQDTIEKLIKAFLHPEEIYRSSEDDLVQRGEISREKARKIVLSRNSFRASYKLEKLRMNGIRFIYYGSEDYPDSLLILDDKPFALYVKGKLPDPDLPSAGIVGARNCSGYGKEMTMRYSQTLAAAGVQIISGLAVGVDSYAAKGALEAGGKTFAVLGSGLDVIYPRENIELYYQIILNGGGILSEFPMGTAPVGWHFPHRNRLISALSEKLLIMEARKNSGTLSTASYALVQGKDVYALPGRVTDPLSEGCNRMIADGAGVLLDPQELLEDYFGHGASLSGRTQTPERKNFPSDSFACIYQTLEYEPKRVVQIAKEAGIPVEKTASILAEMELQGICSQVSKDYYAKET